MVIVVKPAGGVRSRGLFIVSLVVILGITLCSLLLLVNSAKSSGGAGTIHYEFKDAFAGSGDLVVLGDLSVAPETSQKSYGAAIGARAIGQERSFQFTVPETGHYMIAFQGYLYFRAGIGELLINNQSIGTYDFYDSEENYGSTISMTTLELTQGVHTLTFKAVGKNPLADSGNYYYMYPSSLLLTPDDGGPNILLEAHLEKTLIARNETTSAISTASMSDGSDLLNPVYTYSSSDTTIATVNSSGMVKGITAGAATITTTLSTLNGTASSTAKILVSEEIRSETVRYNFIDAFSGSGDLVILGDLSTPAESSQKSYGAAIGARAIGQERSFHITIPETGSYKIAFQGYLYFQAGIGELLINNQSIGTYDFYDAGAKYGPTVSMDTIELTQGVHTLTFRAVGRNPLAAQGNNYSMYATALLLTSDDGRPALVLESRPELSMMTRHETTLIESVATMSDGSDLPQLVYAYSSSDETVATVSSSGVISAIAPGSALITTIASGGSDVVSSSFVITVLETMEEAFLYDYRQAFSGTGNLNILGELSATPETSNRSYGAAIGTRAIGQQRSFQFTVPQTGRYLLSFQGFLYFSAGIGEILVNDQSIGIYDFYDPGSVFGPIVPMRTLELAQGDHIITFRAVGRSPLATPGMNYSMYASEMFLTPMASSADLQLMTRSAHSLLAPLETAQLYVGVGMSDGTAVTPASYVHTSSDESVVVVDGTGKITAIGAGTATITSEVHTNRGMATGTTIINVTSSPLVSIDLVLDQSTVYIGQSSKLHIQGTLADATVVDVSIPSTIYSVDDPTMAEISNQGFVRGMEEGVTTLRAEVTFQGQTVSGHLDVNVTRPPLARIELEESHAEITETQYRRLELKGYYENQEEADLSQANIVYSSADVNVVSVDQDGMYYGESTGSTDIQVAVTLAGITKTEQVTVAVVPLTSDKTRSTYYTTEKITNARSNIANYTWAANQANSIVAAADVYVNLGYEFLWNLVPPQSLPRSLAVNQIMGSPVTGKDIDQFGNYPYTADPVNEPWKITDPSSGYKFPTNDFAAYYASGLDDQGTFHQALADPSLLVNTLYPEKGPTWGVDDGNGWIDQDGNVYTFVAYYVHWHLWYNRGIIHNAVRYLRDAYVYTGDMQYARAGIVLLDRIADVYPELDVSKYDSTIYLQSAQGAGTGKAVGAIWETSLVKDFILAYDAFYPVMDDPQVIAFLGQKGQDYKLSLKESGTGLRRNAEQGILKQVYPGVLHSQIRGNVGMHQSALAMAAVVYDTLPDTQIWLDFNNQTGGRLANPWRVTGGNLLTSLIQDVDRDGHGNESAPGYNRLWLGNFLQVADVLLGYDKYPQADLYEHVKFEQMFHAKYPLLLSEQYMPSIGDSESTGNPNRTGLDINQMIKAFEVYGDPIFAQVIHFLNNHSSEGIYGNIFSANPGAVATQIDQVIDQHGPLVLSSDNLTGYGFAALRDGFNDKEKHGVLYDFPDLHVTHATTDYQVYASSGTVQLEANEPGHSITFQFQVTDSDEYHVRLQPFRASSYGIYDVLINNTFVKQIDFYGSNKNPELLQVMYLTAGTHTISFVNQGRSSLATNYKAGFTELQLLTHDEALLVAGQKNTLRDIWLYYGRTSGHGHRDALNLGVHAYGLDLAPDLGYPEYANAVDMHRAQWVNNTISHNTVVVDQRKQQPQFVGMPLHFDDTYQVKLVDIEAPRAYSQLDEYRRTSAMIRVDDDHSYTVDFFRVLGGNDHHFSFHSAAGTVTTEGLNLITQPTGTYAGAGVDFGERVDDVEGHEYMGSGFHWLKDVERDAQPATQFSVDWNVLDTWNVFGNGANAATDVHLRLTMLGQVDSVALANGVPPRNKPGNPESLRYMIAHRTGSNLESLFTSVIEPYKSQRYISNISESVITHHGTPVNMNSNQSVRAIKVELTNGRVDTIIYSADPTQEYIIDGNIAFSGFFGVLSQENGQVVYSYVNDGSYIGLLGDVPAYVSALHGTVSDFTRGLSRENEIIVTMDAQGIPMQDWVGRMVYIQNDGARNAAYFIEAVTELGPNTYRFDIGTKTLIRSYVDTHDFSKGYVYDISPGATFTIPLSYESYSAGTMMRIDGEQVNGWYIGAGATVTFATYGSAPSGLATMYRLNGTEWQMYSGPIELLESGEHIVEYRLYKAGLPTGGIQMKTIPVDLEQPQFTLFVNDLPVSGEITVEDTLPLEFSLQTLDMHSGIRLQSYTVTGAVYGNGTHTDQVTVDWLGQVGVHTIIVHVEDYAGNVVNAPVSIIVTNNFTSIGRLLDQYLVSGDLAKSIESRLSNSLRQAKHHFDKGSISQSSKFLEKMLKHLHDTSVQQRLSQVVRDILIKNVQHLIETL